MDIGITLAFSHDQDPKRTFGALPRNECRNPKLIGSDRESWTTAETAGARISNYLVVRKRARQELLRKLCKCSVSSVGRFKFRDSPFFELAALLDYSYVLMLQSLRLA